MTPCLSIAAMSSGGGEAIAAMNASTSSTSAVTATVVLPIVRDVVDDVGTAHAGDGVHAPGLEPQPGVHVSDVVGDDQFRQRALFAERRTAARRSGALAAAPFTGRRRRSHRVSWAGSAADVGAASST
jgi:hypothetical protein